jgi:mono/diheme cytochrome c family protein
MDPTPRHRARRLSGAGAALLAAVTAFTTTPAAAATPGELLTGYRAAAGSAAPSTERGRQLFVTTHGQLWSCASCHGATPTQPGRHAATGKPIAPLAPAFDALRFTDAAKTEKWFRRNCNDVVGRECSAAEKADVLAWLISLAP